MFLLVVRPPFCQRRAVWEGSSGALVREQCVELRLAGRLPSESFSDTHTRRRRLVHNIAHTPQRTLAAKKYLKVCASRNHGDKTYPPPPAHLHSFQSQSVGLPAERGGSLLMGVHTQRILFPPGNGT
ncbi:unnamed protein product [Arctogadus glacialis]